MYNYSTSALFPLSVRHAPFYCAISPKCAHIRTATKSAFRNMERSTEYLRFFCKMKTQSIYDMLVKLADQAKVKHFSTHDLRRSFVSDLLDAGTDIATVAKMVSHASISTTQRYDRRGEQAR